MIAIFVLAATVTLSPAEAAVTDFYALVVRHQPLGIPEKKAKRAMWPRLTPRLQRALETAAACEADYFRQHPASSDEKPEFWWLEHGLFSGGNERAQPAKVRIVSSENNRVHVRLTDRDAYEWNVDVRVACAKGRCRIDDVIEFDEEGKPHPPLTESFRGCNGAKWVGVP